MTKIVWQRGQKQSYEILDRLRISNTAENDNIFNPCKVKKNDKKYI